MRTSFARTASSRTASARTASARTASARTASARTASARNTLGRACGVLLGVVTVMTIDARQTPAPSTPSPSPTAPAQQGQPSPGRSGGPDTRGPVRGPGGEIIGFTSLAEIPGTPWRIHDAARPHPRSVTPGATPGAPPADAIVLFDGKDLSKWAHSRKGADRRRGVADP